MQLLGWRVHGHSLVVDVSHREDAAACLLSINDWDFICWKVLEKASRKLTRALFSLHEVKLFLSQFIFNVPQPFS